MATDWTTATDEQILAADLMIEQGLDELPIEDQRRVLEAMNSAIDEAVLMKALTGLDPTDQTALQQLVADGDAEAVRHFLTAKVPTYDDIFQQMVIRYKRVILTGERPSA